MNANESYWVGLAIQYFKSVPLTGRWKVAQPFLAIVLLAGISAFCYWLAVPDSTHHGVRFFILGASEWAKNGLVGQVVTSLIAQGAVAIGFDPAHAAIPVTNK